jgi:hypothetical protein
MTAHHHHDSTMVVVVVALGVVVMTVMTVAAVIVMMIVIVAAGVADPGLVAAAQVHGAQQAGMTVQAVGGHDLDPDLDPHTVGAVVVVVVVTVVVSAESVMRHATVRRYQSARGLCVVAVGPLPGALRLEIGAVAALPHVHLHHAHVMRQLPVQARFEEIYRQLNHSCAANLGLQRWLCRSSMPLL